MENKLLNKATFTYNHSERKLESVMTHNGFGDILEVINRLMMSLNFNQIEKFTELLDRDDEITFSHDFVYEFKIYDQRQCLSCSTEEIDENIIEGLLRVLIDEDFNFACRMYGLSPECTKPLFIETFKDIVENTTFNKDEFMDDLHDFWIADEVQQFQDYLDNYDMSFFNFMEMYHEFKDLDEKAQEKVFQLAEAEYEAVEGVSLDLA